MSALYFDFVLENLNLSLSYSIGSSVVLGTKQCLSPSKNSFLSSLFSMSSRRMRACSDARALSRAFCCHKTASSADCNLYLVFLQKMLHFLNYSYFIFRTLCISYSGTVVNSVISLSLSPG